MNGITLPQKTGYFQGLNLIYNSYITSFVLESFIFFSILYDDMIMIYVTKPMTVVTVMSLPLDQVQIEKKT